MRIERPYAYCCAEGGGSVEHCDCVKKDHGAAFFDVADDAAPMREDVTQASKFVSWDTGTLVAQCRMQARDSLDPEYVQFMCAVADRLAHAARPDAGDEVERIVRIIHDECENDDDSGGGAYQRAAVRIAAMREGVDRGMVEREALPFYDAVKAYSHPSGVEVTVRIHETGWDVYKPAPAVAPATHEYAQSMVGHGEAQCIYCHGTNRENAIISPNVCQARAAALSRKGG